MSLDSFLVSKGTSLDSVVAQAVQSIEILEGENLLAVGSLVEGLGTPKSDLDLLLLSKRDASSLPEQSEISWASGRCLVDMRILPGPLVADLLARFSSWSKAGWNPTFPPRFSVEERTLLHRMAAGRRLVLNRGPAPGVHAAPDAACLARLKLHAARHEARTVQVDMAGLRDAGDCRSLCFAAAQLMGLAIDAILAGHRLTNPLPKWRSRLLQDVPDAWRSGTLPRLSCPVADVVWKLSNFPETCTADSALRFALRISAFSRASFVWAEDVLLRPSEETIEPTVDGPPSEATRPLPFLDFDIDFNVDGDTTFLGRLNDFSEPLVISRPELDAALLFDGETCAEEADNLVLRRRGRTVSASSLSKQCAMHGLLALTGP